MKIKSIARKIVRRVYRFVMGRGRQLDRANAEKIETNDTNTNIEINHIFIEITSLCNMHCTFCPSDIMKRKKCNAKNDNVTKILSELNSLDTKRKVHFNVLGEPLLNKNFFKYLDICKNYNFTAIVITNFTLLNVKYAEKLFKYDNLILVLSLQTVNENSYKMRGYSKLTYNQYHEQLL